MKRLALAFVLPVFMFGACQNSTPDPNAVPSTTLDQVPGHDTVTQDTSHKESPRLVPAEAYMRTYLTLFGGLTPLQAQTLIRQTGTNIFDNWASYLGALGLPSYTTDLPRKGETNALMMATFERLGIALCDRAMELDILASPAPSVDKRLIYGFDIPAAAADLPSFTTRFDLLHRTFLSYPAAMAPTDRTNRFFKLYQTTVAQHDPKSSKFSATQAGWAAVCYGLVRHPEFHLY